MNKIGIRRYRIVVLCAFVTIICVNVETNLQARMVSVDGYTFRDLNKDGKLDPYEDRRLPASKRVDDLLDQMNLEEAVGLMFCPIIGMHPDGSLVEDQSFYSQIGSTEAIIRKHISHVGSFIPMHPEVVAQWNNNLQKLAESTRLSIPASICSDPRHGTNKPYTINNSYFPEISHWPDALGMAATRDMELIRQFGSIAAQEYRAVGITVALHPMADLATEPRWGRIAGTFGEDAELAGKCVAAYIKGFQGETLGSTSVACMTKHFPGGGPQKDGWDCHYQYGKEQVYPGDNFDYHLIPFKAAIATKTAQIMPYFGIAVGQTRERVSFGFSKEIVTDLLRDRLGFQGVIASDGGIVSSYVSDGKVLSYAKCWGVENLSIKERFKKARDAGLDQFLVECTPEIVIELVGEGSITHERIYQSARRILRDKFMLGLFDNPYVDPGRAGEICGSPEFQTKADLAQRKSIVLLKNGFVEEDKLLPIKSNKKVFVIDINTGIASKYAKVVNRIEDADVAIIRVSTPYEQRQGLLELLVHQGTLNFKGKALRRIRQIMRAKPTVVCIYIERAAVIPEIAEEAAALLATFGCSDSALLDIIFGKFKPTGKLPIELPCSMIAVRKQKEDLPYDSQSPLFEFDFGLTY